MSTPFRTAAWSTGVAFIASTIGLYTLALIALAVAISALVVEHKHGR
jgi:hypothetical protein